MNESDITEYIVGFFLAFLFLGLIFFITFLPQIDCWLEKRKNKTRLIIPNYTTPRAKDRSR